MEFSEARDEIFEGLRLLRSKLDQPTFDAKVDYTTKKGDKTNFEYATLKAIISSIDKAASDSDSGISWQQEALTENNEVLVMTLITHTSGQYIIHGPLRFPKGGGTPQSIGSTITYAKRYALSSAFGIAADTDDDGKTALDIPTNEKNKTSNNQQNELSEPQIVLAKNKIKEFIELSDIDKAAFQSLILHDLSIELVEVSNLSTNQFQKLMNYLNRESNEMKKSRQQHQNQQNQNIGWGQQ